VLELKMLGMFFETQCSFLHLSVAKLVIIGDLYLYLDFLFIW